MELKKHHILLILIFLFSIAFRLFFAFQTPYFSNDNSYFVLRQVDYISKTGLPLYDDPLSYSGRNLPFTPFFQYILAFFNLFLPLNIVGKIIPNILASTIIFVAYLIVFEITKNRRAAVAIALTSAFIPIFIRETVNSVSDFSIVIPILLFIIYFLLKIDESKKYVVLLLVMITLLVLTSPIFVVLLLGLIFYFLLLKTEKIGHERDELEIILFSGFLYFWFNFIIFKKAFLLYGPGIIWQNIPNILLSTYFFDINILESVYAVGVIPFIFGIFIIYTFVFKQKNKAIYLLTSLALSVFILLWLKLLPFVSGLIFLGSFLVLLLGQYIKSFLTYIEKSKFSRRTNLFFGLFILLIFITSLVPCILYSLNSVEKAPSKEMIDALDFIKHNTEQNSVVLGSIAEGHLITYFSERKNVIDSDFLLIRDINQRIPDIDKIYTTIYKTDAIKLLNKYSINYIILSNETMTRYKITDLKYYDTECFNLVYDNKVKIYQSLCKLEAD